MCDRLFIFRLYIRWCRVCRNGGMRDLTWCGYYFRFLYIIFYKFDNNHHKKLSYDDFGLIDIYS